MNSPAGAAGASRVCNKKRELKYGGRAKIAEAAADTVSTQASRLSLLLKKDHEKAGHTPKTLHVANRDCNKREITRRDSFGEMKPRRRMLALRNLTGKRPEPI